MTKDLLDCDSREINELYQRIRGISSQAGVIWVTPGEFKPQSRHSTVMQCGVKRDKESKECGQP